MDTTLIAIPALFMQVWFIPLYFMVPVVLFRYYLTRK